MDADNANFTKAHTREISDGHESPPFLGGEGCVGGGGLVGHTSGLISKSLNGAER